jgi:Fur family ferric uptake transcriptional regulator
VKSENDYQFTREGALPELVDRLTKAGYSNTRARRAVLDALVAAVGPVSPADLLQAGRRLHPPLGLVTVYRTLELLEQLGLVRKLHLEEGCHSYALSTAALREGHGHEHGPDAHGHHVICQECHRAVEFAGCDIDAVIASVQQQTGFAVRSHWLEMFGLCPTCQENQS